METVIAERRFVAEASIERVWDLLGRVMFDSLHGLERVNVIDERNFRAILRVKLGFISLTARLKGEMADISPPGFLAVVLRVRFLRGMLQLGQKVTFRLTAVDEGKTEVVCRAQAEGMGTLFRWLLLGKAREFAGETLSRIEERLQQVA